MSDCTVYIDESGDLGVNRGTVWFVLSAVIVNKTEEPNIRATIQKIRAKANVNEIHMKKIVDFYKRAYVVNSLNNEEFTYMNILVDTTKFDHEKIPNPMIAYNFVCKYLLQRVSWCLEETHRTADIILSARGTKRDGELIDYIKTKLLPYPENSINKNVFEKIIAKQAPQWDLLQLADVCATTTFWAYEKNPNWGFCTPCFSIALSDHLYKRAGKVKSYGIKFFTQKMEPDVEQLRSLRICAKKERTPGATTT